MKVLVVGGGGREHAICRALQTGGSAVEVVAAPGNAGIADGVRTFGVGAADVAGLVALARREQVDLVVPGPEACLVAGLADQLDPLGIPCCGPRRAAAQLEGSKAFTRELAERAGAPGPLFKIVQTPAEVERALSSWEGVPVVKADGLAAGKGVFLPETKAAAAGIARRLLDGEMGTAGRVVVLEERRVGIEASLFWACDGTTCLALPHARDHKRLLDGDRGPNTGGMGAVSPNPQIDDSLQRDVESRIIVPVLKALAARGSPFRGFLFAGLILDQEGPQLLEFNVRLGDPEAQVILPRLPGGTFLDICRAVVDGSLSALRVAPESLSTCGIVLAAAGYPEKPRRGDRIKIRPEFDCPDRWLDHAATGRQEDFFVTNGGRVATVLARAESPAAARTLAYAGTDLVQFSGMQLRRDIGWFSNNGRAAT